MVFFQIQHVLEEWTDGTCIKKKFEAEQYRREYLHFIKRFEKLKVNAPNWISQLMIKLYNNVW